jgi:MFS family permease
MTTVLQPTSLQPTIAARLDRLPPNRHVRWLVTLISFGGWFEFYDLFFTAYIAVGLFQSGLFRPTTQGLFDLEGFASFIAALFTGLFLGTIAFSWLSDRFGRRAIFTFALLWYSAGSLVMAFQTSAAGIDLWRFIASIGLGVELVNIDTYISELVPKEQRGPAFAYNQFVMFTVVPVVALLAWLLVPRQVLGLDGGWSSSARPAPCRCGGSGSAFPNRRAGSPSTAAAKRPSASCATWRSASRRRPGNRCRRRRCWTARPRKPRRRAHRKGH